VVRSWHGAKANGLQRTFQNCPGIQKGGRAKPTPGVAGIGGGGIVGLVCGFGSGLTPQETTDQILKGRAQTYPQAPTKKNNCGDPPRQKTSG